MPVLPEAMDETNPIPRPRPNAVELPASPVVAPGPHDPDLDLVARMRARDDQATGLFFDRWADLVEAVADFTRHPAHFVERGRALALADWVRRAEHPDHGHDSVFVMLRPRALHDMLHSYRIEALLLKKAWATEHGA